MSLKRETLSSRLGFILLSAGCAIGLGNVWRFPYITGRYGGAAFILLYIAFLLLFGMPIMVMEFAVGRASKRTILTAFDAIRQKKSKWHVFGVAGLCGNYLLMMFYSVVSGWMLYYLVETMNGKFAGLSSEQIGGIFGGMLADPVAQIFWMLVVVFAGFFICSFGLQEGVEKSSKFFMSGLLAIVVVLAVRVAFLPGAAKGYEFYLKPDFAKIAEVGWGEAIYAALGQAFFTLSIGMGALLVFGSYITRERRLAGESAFIISLDTFVALMAGMIIFPAAAAFGISADAGPGLIFITLPNIFSKMPGGRIWQACFFLFMSFAAMTTIVAVFENLVGCLIDRYGISRQKSVVINAAIVFAGSIPCALGFNVWAGFQPLGAGTGILDLEDFLVSNNILPLGSMCFLVFCCFKRGGWGWEGFTEEANAGKGMKFPVAKAYRFYISVVLPFLMAIVFGMGYYQMFRK